MKIKNFLEREKTHTRHNAKTTGIGILHSVQSYEDHVEKVIYWYEPCVYSCLYYYNISRPGNCLSLVSLHIASK